MRPSDVSTMTSTVSVESSARLLRAKKRTVGCSRPTQTTGEVARGAGRQLHRLGVARAAHLEGLVLRNHRGTAAELPLRAAGLEAAAGSEPVVGLVAPGSERLGGGLRGAIGGRRDQQRRRWRPARPRRVRRSRLRRRKGCGEVGCSCSSPSGIRARFATDIRPFGGQRPSIGQTSIRATARAADKTRSDADFRRPPIGAHPCRGRAPRGLRQNLLRAPRWTRARRRGRERRGLPRGGRGHGGAHPVGARVRPGRSRLRCSPPTP